MIMSHSPRVPACTTETCKTCKTWSTAPKLAWSVLLMIMSHSARGEYLQPTCKLVSKTTWRIWRCLQAKNCFKIFFQNTFTEILNTNLPVKLYTASLKGNFLVIKHLLVNQVMKNATTKLAVMRQIESKCP